MAKHSAYPCVPIPILGGPAPSGYQSYLILGPKGAFTNHLTSSWSIVDLHNLSTIKTGCTIDTASPGVITVPGGHGFQTGETVDIFVSGATANPGGYSLNGWISGCVAASATTLTLPAWWPDPVSDAGVAFTIAYFTRLSSQQIVTSTELTAYGEASAALGILCANSVYYNRAAGGYIDAWHHVAEAVGGARLTNQQLVQTQYGLGRGIQSAVFIHQPHPNAPNDTTKYWVHNPNQAGSSLSKDLPGFETNTARDHQVFGSPCPTFSQRLYRVQPIAPPIQAAAAEVVVEAVPLEWQHDAGQWETDSIYSAHGGGPYNPVICPDVTLGQKVLQNALAFGDLATTKTAEIHRYRATFNSVHDLDQTSVNPWGWAAPLYTFRGCSAGAVQKTITGGRGGTDPGDASNAAVGFFNRSYFLRARRSDGLAEVVDLTNAGLYAANGGVTLNQTVPDKTITGNTAGTSTTITFTTATAQFYPEFGGVPGDRMFVYVDITGCNDTACNGKHIARVVANNQIQLTLSSAAAGNANTGTIRFRIVAAGTKTTSSVPGEFEMNTNFYPERTDFILSGSDYEFGIPFAPQALYHPTVGVMLGCWNTGFNENGTGAGSGYLAIAVIGSWSRTALGLGTKKSIETSAHQTDPARFSPSYEDGFTYLNYGSGTVNSGAQATNVGQYDSAYTAIIPWVQGGKGIDGPNDLMTGGYRERNSYLVTAAGTTYLEAVTRCRDMLTYMVANGIG